MDADDLSDAHLRKILYVRARGEENPFWLCTYDFTLSKLVEPEPSRLNFKRKKRKTRK